MAKYHLDDGSRVPVSTSLGIHALGASSPHGDPNDIPTIVASIGKRVAGDPPKPDLPLYGQFRRFVSDWLRKHLTPLDSCTDVSVDAWLAGSNYPMGRRRQLKQRHEQILSNLIHSSRSSAKLVKCFVKDESYLSFKHVRCIYARVDDLKLVFGPYFKAIESVVYANKHFIKHVPVKDRAKLLLERLIGEIKQSSDYTGYEKHFTDVTYEIEFELYKHMLQNLPQSKWIIQQMEAVMKGMNTCKFKRLTALLPSGRMSGEMNTSLGNGFMNLMLFLFQMHLKGNHHYDCFVEGDDLIAVYSGIRITSEDYLKLGMTIKLENHEHINEASFCGLVYDPEDGVSICDPLKVLLNVGWCSARYLNASEKSRKGLLRAKGLSLLYQYPGVPIIQSLAQYIIRVTEGSKYKLPGEWTHWQVKHFKTNGVAKPIGDNTRFLMEKVFGFSVFEQKELEQYFDTKKEISPIDHPLLLSKFSLEQREYNDIYVSDPKVHQGRPYIAVVPSTTRLDQQVVDRLLLSMGKTKVHQDIQVNTDLYFPQ